MIHLQNALARLDEDLRKIGLRWALLGGVAVSALSEPRTTRDLDVAIAVESDTEAEDVVREFFARGYHFHDPVEQVETGRIATIRLLAPKDRDVVVDLLFASSGIEPEIVAAARPLEILPDLIVPVISMGHLLALKILAGRPQDRADAANLLRYAAPGDLAETRAALDLILERGFDRGKPLGEELDRLLSSLS